MPLSSVRLVPAITLALAWRILIASLTTTFFQPDEYFQSLEVAHRAVFGYGHLTWEWTSTPPIRSIAFPALYMPVYWLLRATNLDDSPAIILVPKIFQGILVSLTDIATRELARRILGDRYANVAFYISLSSLFHILTLGRTLANSAETTLTTIALCFWPWQSSDNIGGLHRSLAFAAVACLIRPTNALIWIFLYAELLWRVRKTRESLINALSTSIYTATVSLASLVAIDAAYYGRLTFTPLNFLVTNLSSVSLFYGQAPWHYYLLQGLPILLNVMLPSFVIGARDIVQKGARHQRIVLYLIGWTIAVYSLLGHKEWRFLHPILPLMLIISAKYIVDHGPLSGIGPSKGRSSSVFASFSSTQLFLLVTGLLPAMYLMRYHGAAQISVMHYLRTLGPDTLHSAGFLMPCHSTPWQAYLHRPSLSEGHLWALGCEPPTGRQDLLEYRDQAAIFYESPMRYLEQNFPSTVDPAFPPSPSPATVPGTKGIVGRWDHRWPSHLIFFGALIEGEEGDRLRRFFRRLGYREVWSVGNGFEEDWRRKGGVKVWMWCAEM